MLTQFNRLMQENTDLVLSFSVSNIWLPAVQYTKIQQAIHGKPAIHRYFFVKYT